MFSIDALLSSSRRPEYEGSFQQFLPRWQTSTNFGYTPSRVPDFQPFGGKFNKLYICINNFFVFVENNNTHFIYLFRKAFDPVVKIFVVYHCTSSIYHDFDAVDL